MALYPPSEVPQGAIRLNTDSQKLEFYAQDQWWEMATHNINLDGGSRGVRGGAQVGGAPYPTTDRIDYFTISTAGNAIDFGNLTGNHFGPAGAGSRTRGLFMGGGPTRLASVDFITFSSTGDAQDFGDMTYARAPGGNGALSNETRAVLGPGSSNSSDWEKEMDYITIASTGNGADFGDLAGDQSGAQGTSSPTRGIFAGGSLAPAYAYHNVIQYITIATLGDAQDFGDLAWAGNGRACSNGIRSVSSNSTPSATTALQSGLIATRGNYINYGDLATANDGGGSFTTSDKTRGLWGINAPSATNTMEYISMSTGGTGADFGDLTQEIGNSGGTSNAHGGL